MAAPSHVVRLETLEHRLLLWLNAHVRYRTTSLLYHDLLSHFRLVTVSARRSYHDIMFMFKAAATSSPGGPINLFCCGVFPSTHLIGQLDSKRCSLLRTPE